MSVSRQKDEQRLLSYCNKNILWLNEMKKERNEGVNPLGPLARDWTEIDLRVSSLWKNTT